MGSTTYQIFNVYSRLSLRGHRKLNNAIHMVALTQIRSPCTEGRIHFERQVAEGKTKKDAFRSHKRHVSNAIEGSSSSMSKGAREDTRERLIAAWSALHPEGRLFGEVTPGPLQSLRICAVS